MQGLNAKFWLDHPENPPLHLTDYNITCSGANLNDSFFSLKELLLGSNTKNAKYPKAILPGPAQISTCQGWGLTVVINAGPGNGLVQIKQLAITGAPGIPLERINTTSMKKESTE